MMDCILNDANWLITHSLNASVSLFNSAISKKLQFDTFCTVGRSACNVGQRAIKIRSSY